MKYVFIFDSDVNEERDDSSVQLFKVFGFDFVGDLEFPNHLDIIFNIARCCRR